LRFQPPEKPLRPLSATLILWHYGFNPIWLLFTQLDAAKAENNPKKNPGAEVKVSGSCQWILMQNANGQQSALMHVMCKRFSGVGKGLSLAAVIDGQIEMAKSN